MESGIKKINDVLEYIERHIFEEITCKELAQVAILSEYEFRRVFSFLLGVPIGEYIRKRRLTIAAEELKSGKKMVSELAISCGYDAPSSFTRAFKEEFGVSPSEAKNASTKLEVWVKPRLVLSVQGGMTMSYTEQTLPSFAIKGVCGESTLCDTCCCESVWQEFEKTEAGKTLSPIYAAYVNGAQNVVCYIGEKIAVEEAEKNGSLAVLGGKWICFDLSVETPEKEVNDLYEKITYSFLSSSIYERDENRPNVEVFDDQTLTVMIPVTVKKEN